MAASAQSSYLIDFQPIGKRVSVSGEVNLLTAAQEAGVAISAVCGGVGVCGDCRVRLMSGQASRVTDSERKFFSEVERTEGWRLACQVFPLSDLKIEVPPESLTTSQRLQTEGLSKEIELDPMVKAFDFELPPPNLEDLRSDWERFVEAFKGDQGQLKLASIPVLAQLSSRLRKQDWKGRVLITKGQDVVGFLQPSQAYYGVAVDIGTTKMAAFLVDLSSGETVGRTAEMNPQIAYGEDVVSRIAYANQGAVSRQTLRDKVVGVINQMTLELCQSVGVDLEQVADFVVVGNTAMHHLFVGLGVRQLGEAPYVPALRGALRFPAREIGLKGAPGAAVYLPPNIAGHSLVRIQKWAIFINRQRRKVYSRRGRSVFPPSNRPRTVFTREKCALRTDLIPQATSALRYSVRSEAQLGAALARVRRFAVTIEVQT